MIGCRLPWLPLSVAFLCATAGLAGERRVIVEHVDRYRVTDPLFECVRVVLAHRGEQYSPAYIQGVSGAAFRIAGPCPCAPTCSAAMDTPDLVRLLGYEAEHVPLYGKGVDPERDARKLLPRIRDEVRAGRAVIVWHAFTNAEWDVVCGFDEAKKQFLGRGSYAGIDGLAKADEMRLAKCLEICPAIGVIFVGRKTGTFDARAAELDALQEALRHARRPKWPPNADPAASGVVWRFHEGLACFDWWADSFRQDPNRGANAGDKYCLNIVRSRHRAAAGFLKELAAKYADAKGPLEKAAGHFTADADTLDACHKLEGMDWGDKRPVPPNRNARAAELLGKARDAYARGIGEIAAALKRLDPARLARSRQAAVPLRRGGRVWIGGVGNLSFDCRGNSFCGALASALRVSERPLGYEDLMGLTALAFRVRWCNDRTKTQWCPSCAIGEMPDEIAAARKLTGWELAFEWTEAKARDNDTLRKRLVAEIDAGRCVLAYPANWNVGVIYGYADSGKQVLLRDYARPEEDDVRLPVEKLGPMRIYLGKLIDAPAPREGLKQALTTAVTNWKRTRHDGGLPGREYFYGEAAFEAWIADLRRYDDLDAAGQKALRALDPWVFRSLLDARRTASKFLDDWSILVAGEAREALQRAAEQYGKLTTLLEPLREQKKRPEAEQDWSPAARDKQAAALAKARALDAAAVAEIEKALAAMQ